MDLVVVVVGVTLKSVGVEILPPIRKLLSDLSEISLLSEPKFVKGKVSNVDLHLNKFKLNRNILNRYK